MSFKEHPPHLHVPVLLEATIDTLQPVKGENYLDLTAGYGGHARRFFSITENYDDSTLVDRDSFAIAELAEFSERGVQLLHTDFVSAVKGLIEQGRTYSIVLVDLGVSSPQLDKSERGFSFTHNGPLDMRMDDRQSLTAETLVNKASMNELIHIIRTYGEETLGFARRIAETIRLHRPIKTTGQLAELIKDVHIGKWQKIHPATRTFQALRIAVNQELRQVEELLPLIPRLLKRGGRIGIISFHSLEDRLVKQYFNEQKNAGYEAELQLLTKKPLSGDIYDVHNPRSRSAKLRAAVKK
ncbi:MAG: 16S rRNA (cytosine(1402)-N(4))-methyltransferase RsmH [Candidatus Saccharimonadales bacterium]